MTFYTHQHGGPNTKNFCVLHLIKFLLNYWFVYLYLKVCCRAGMKTPLTVDPQETKKSASLSGSCFVRVATVILGVVGWTRAADERRFCQSAPRDALLRICLQDNTDNI